VLEKRRRIVMTRRDFHGLQVSSGMEHRNNWKKLCDDVRDCCRVLTGAGHQEAAQLVVGAVVALDPSYNLHNPMPMVQH